MVSSASACGHARVRCYIKYILIEKDYDFVLEFLNLWIADWTYGFGYKRYRILRFFFIVWSIGCICAYWSLREKQKKLLKNSINLRNNEIDDEKIVTITEIQNDQVKEKLEKNELLNYTFKLTNRTLEKPFHEIKQHLDCIDRIIFLGHLDRTIFEAINYNNKDSLIYEQERKNISIKSNNVNKIKSEIYLGIKPDRQESLELRKDLKNSEDIEFIRVTLDSNKPENKQSSNINIKEQLTMIKYIIENINARSQNKERQIGICSDLFPDGDSYLVYSIEGNKSIDCFFVYSLEQEEFLDEFIESNVDRKRKNALGVSFLLIIPAFSGICCSLLFCSRCNYPEKNVC